MMIRRLAAVVVLTLLLGVGIAATAPAASAHVHGVTPLATLANVCGVTTLSNTGANRAQGAPIHGLIPRDVGNSPLTVGDGGRFAPVGCATH